MHINSAQLRLSNSLFAGKITESVFFGVGVSRFVLFLDISKLKNKSPFFWNNYIFKGNVIFLGWVREQLLFYHELFFFSVFLFLAPKTGMFSCSGFLLQASAFSKRQIAKQCIRGGHLNGKVSSLRGRRILPSSGFCNVRKRGGTGKVPAPPPTTLLGAVCTCRLEPKKMSWNVHSNYWPRAC